MSEEGLSRVEMKADTLSAEVLPQLGGKISSLRYKGAELLQAPLREYGPRTLDMDFADSDASGIDECLPTVAPSEIPGPSGKVMIPDHGEFWRLPCDVEVAGEREIRLAAQGFMLPLRLERRLTLDESTLRIDYRLENLGETEIPYLWSAHPLFVVEEGDIVVLPDSVTQLTVENSIHDRLGLKGEKVSWPWVSLVDGRKMDISRAEDAEENVGDKLWCGAPREGWAELERRHAGLRVRVGFDGNQTPYLGLWLCYGGWPEGQTKRQQCVAIEPCTAPGDSLAEALTKGWAQMLAPGQSVIWWMTIAVSEIS